jgi:RHS repeat-associated protein
MHDSILAGNIWQGRGTYDVRLNPTLTGSVTYADITHASSIVGVGGHQTLGRGVLSSEGVQNRFGYAGYRYDHHLSGGAGAGRHLYHVRHRVYQAHIGRWATRGPLGYVDGMGLYEYVLGMPLALCDPQGLQVAPPPTGPVRPGPTRPGPTRREPTRREPGRDRPSKDRPWNEPIHTPPAWWPPNRPLPDNYRPPQPWDNDYYEVPGIGVPGRCPPVLVPKRPAAPLPQLTPTPSPQQRRPARPSAQPSDEECQKLKDRIDEECTESTGCSGADLCSELRRKEMAFLECAAAHYKFLHSGCEGAGDSWDGTEFSIAAASLCNSIANVKNGGPWTFPDGGPTIHPNLAPFVTPYGRTGNCAYE